MSHGPGAFQRRILEHLHTPVPRAFTVAELAHALTGSTADSQMRQIRRAVEGLARRGRVVTWTGRANLNWGPGPRALWGRKRAVKEAARPDGLVRLMVNRRGFAVECAGEGCEKCAVEEAKVRPRDGWRYHSFTLTPVFKSRVRWVELAWEERPSEERRRLLRRWIREDRKALATQFPDGEPPDEGDFWQGLAHTRWERMTAALAKYEADLVALKR